jgi:4a-hydroxytetrahydrobiopterin dehydratase
MTPQEITDSLQKLAGWSLDETGKIISKRYRFPDFATALAYVNRLGAVAESKNHHPDLTLGWGYVGVSFTTHDAGGLRPADFAMAQVAEDLAL